ncbi:MAG: bifunctional rhamnulose-1-phosphate aldolase/short-chain dehydrogenase [Armatimonadetes bacterium]|nr:bifunctional rhamnulose-1-phosphate aldolase/short-chain dehydrogenase [Armatimonadota bacterium]
MPNPNSIIASLWDASAAPSDPLDLLVYASNLLGSDPRITNFGGGNTSSKVTATDPLTGEPVEVLWVKGSGGDLGSAKRGNFASLYQSSVLRLEQIVKDRGLHEDDVVSLYRHCIFDLNPSAPSIDTPLHAFVPYAAVSHMHSDSVIAIAASENCEELTKQAFGGEMGFLPWKRPGFDLGLMLRDVIAANPGIKGAMMQSHGFICWADTWQECYELTLKFINQATEFIEKNTKNATPFGQLGSPITDVALSDLLPILRGKVAFNGKKLIASVDQSPEVLEYLSGSEMPRLAQLGTSCPDHFLRTKIRPLVLTPTLDEAEIEAAFAAFRADYEAYYNRCRLEDSPAMRNPNPSIVLLPGLGMVSFGKNAQEASVTGAFYKNAIAVMRGAERVSKYVALPEQEAFNIEYWQLEEAKLKRMPPEKEMSGQIAVVTGGASGIGKATARKMIGLGAHVAILDINEDGLAKTAAELQALATSKNVIIGIRCDVTSADSIRDACAKVVATYGGLDVVVANAGNARRGSVADTSPADYELLSSLLMKGYFDTLGEAIKIMLLQKTGGSCVVVGSKNGVAAGNNAALYSAAKAFELHLMRVTASDFAKHGIRCNAINPDGVVTDSAIWSAEWKEQTAKALGIKPEELVEHYAKRSLLGTVVTPDDCAEAICWLGSDARSSRTTGCVITVDGGNKEGFLR